MSMAIWSLSCYGTSMGIGKCWFNYFTITKQLPFFENHVSWLNILQKRVADGVSDEISDGLICIALLFQKRMKHLQIIVNGLVPRDAINTRQRQTLLEVNQVLREKCTSYNSVYFLKPDTDWTSLDGGLNKIFYYKDNTHLLRNGNK